MIQVRRPDIAVKDKESDNAWLINTAVPRHEKVKNKTQWFIHIRISDRAFHYSLTVADPVEGDGAAVLSRV